MAAQPPPTPTTHAHVHDDAPSTAVVTTAAFSSSRPPAPPSPPSYSPEQALQQEDSKHQDDGWLSYLYCSIAHAAKRIGTLVALQQARRMRRNAAAPLAAAGAAPTSAPPQQVQPLDLQLERRSQPADHLRTSPVSSQRHNSPRHRRLTAALSVVSGQNLRE